MESKHGMNGLEENGSTAESINPLKMIEWERERVSALLHDTVCQLLTAVTLKSRSLSDRLAKVNPSLAQEAKTQGELINQALDQLRLISRGLSPWVPEDESFQELLMKLCSATEQLSNIRCRHSIASELKPILGDKAHQLYLIAQEAVTNALRHSKTDIIDIQLIKNSKVMLLTITDQGCGLAESSTALSSGTQILKHRARLLGGQAKIEAVETGGVRVSVTVPLDRME